MEEALQQAPQEDKYMYPARPKIKTPKMTSKLRLPIKLASSSLSKLMAKADEANAAKLMKNAEMAVILY